LKIWEKQWKFLVILRLVAASAYYNIHYNYLIYRSSLLVLEFFLFPNIKDDRIKTV
jgi:hypothetical protein